MFEVGDIVKTKPEWRNPGETGHERYIVTYVNEDTKRCYIRDINDTQPLPGIETVGFETIELVAAERLVYAVRFHRKDGQPVEEYEYHNKDDAVNHFEMFRNDDSNLYTHIDLTETRIGLPEVVLQQIFFNEVVMFKNGDLVTIKEEFRNPGETDQLYRVVNVNDATKRCYIELAECDLPLAPQELASFEMLHLFRTEPTKVHYNDRYVLEDAQGTEYTEVTDSDLLMSQTTGEVFRIFRTDEIDNPIEVEPLQQYNDGVERIMKAEKCDRATAERFYGLSHALTSKEFTVEQGKQVYSQIEALRKDSSLDTAIQSAQTTCPVVNPTPISKQIER